MRTLTALAATLAAAALLSSGSPANAAISVKPDATPERLGQCAIALNQWKSISEAQGRTPEPAIVQRLETIMASPYGQDKSPDSRVAKAMRAKIVVYDGVEAQGSQKLIDTLQADILGCDALFDTDAPLAWPTEAAEPPPKGPFLVGQHYQVKLDISPSYAGYCFLAYDALRIIGDEAGTSLDQKSLDELAGFKAIIEGNTRLYRQAALSSFENRSSYYQTFRRSHDLAAYMALLRADALDCDKYIVPR